MLSGRHDYSRKAIIYASTLAGRIQTVGHRKWQLQYSWPRLVIRPLLQTWPNSNYQLCADTVYLFCTGAELLLSQSQTTDESLVRDIDIYYRRTLCQPLPELISYIFGWVPGKSTTTISVSRFNWSFLPKSSVKVTRIVLPLLTSRASWPPKQPRENALIWQWKPYCS